MSNEIEKAKKPQKTSRRSNLGRGLGSLLGSELSEKTGGFEEKKLTPAAPIAPIKEASQNKEFIHLAIEKLTPNREQPRKKFTEAELKDLTASIKEKGLIQPIVARPMEGGQFQIIAGERRWRASQKAGLEKVPVLLKDVGPQEVLELALIENIQRHDLNPIEEGEAYFLLAEKYKMTQQQIADRVGKDRATVSNSMRILGLSREVRQMVKDGQIQMGHAKVLLSMDAADLQKKLAIKTIKENLSVRALEKAVKKEMTLSTADDEAIELVDDNMNEKLIAGLAGQLQKELGTRVNIKFNGKSGKMEIAFYSLEELNTIADRIQS